MKRVDRFTVLFILGQLLAVAIFSVITLTIEDFLHRRLATVVSETVRNNLLNGNLREVIIVLDSSVLEDFAAVGYFSSKNERIFSLPSKIPPSRFLPKNIDFFEKQIRVPIFFSDGDDTKESGYFLYIYNREDVLVLLIAIAVLVLLISLPILFLEKRKLAKFFEMEKQVALSRQKSDLAKQVAHDIRSPLGALSVALSNPDNISIEKVELAVKASKRIKKIADDLLRTGIPKTCEFEKKSQHCSDLIDAAREVVSEKNLLIDDRHKIVFRNRCQRALIVAEPQEVQRVISNLIDSSLEAMPSGGKVTLGIDKKAGRTVHIYIEDEGIGMSDELIKRARHKGFSTKVEKSNIKERGLGLHHAIQTVEGAGGKLSISSESGVGTKITIVLPLAKD